MISVKEKYTRGLLRHMSSSLLLLFILESHGKIIIITLTDYEEVTSENSYDHSTRLYLL